MGVGVVPSGAGVVTSLIVREDMGSDKDQTEVLVVGKTLTAAAPVTIYSFVPPVSSTVRVYVTYTMIKSDGTDDYGVDLAASFRVSALGVVTARLASTSSLEEPSAAATALPTISTDGTSILLSGGAVDTETWRVGATITTSWRTISP